MIQRRLSALRSLLSAHRLDAVVVTKEVNLHYFSGFRGDDTTLVITQDKAFIVTDSRYTEQAKQQAPEFTLVEQKDGLLKKTAEVLAQEDARAIGFEGNAMIFDTYAKLRELLKGRTFETPLCLDTLRQIKDEGEIAMIRKACEIADAAFDDVIHYMKAGMTEIDVAAHMESFMRAHGSEGPSFTTIMASGVRGALPHGVATDKVIEDGEFVRELYDAVLEAQKYALTLIRPSASGKDVDAKVRAKLQEHDLGFGHGLGHCVGLEIHEEPRLSPKSTCESLQPGIVITDEPGVYIPGFGGLRIEDTVLVTPDGCETLTKADKNLVEIH